jgi:hypothetical protein
MAETQSHSKCNCQRCGGHIEFPSEGVGVWIRCPHCGEKTQLGGVASNPGASPVGKKKSTAWIWILVCVLLVAGTGAGLFILRRVPITQPARLPAKTQPANLTPVPEPEPDLWKGFKPSPVTLDKSPKSRLVYATGTIRNDTDKQRFGVKVALDVLDAQGEKLGTTSDYIQFIDAHKEWTFKALVAFPKAATAKVASITEE